MSGNLVPQDAKVTEARKFAVLAHAGQKRKYTGEEYATHPIRVSKMAEEFLLSPEAVMAAALHDVKEDSPEFFPRIREKFGDEVSKLVDWLTNPSKDSKLPRTERKRTDREHLALAPLEAKLVKAMDRLDNLRDVGLAPKDFRTIYSEESLLLADALLEGESSSQLHAVVRLVRKAATQLA